MIRVLLKSAPLNEHSVRFLSRSVCNAISVRFFSTKIPFLGSISRKSLSARFFSSTIPSARKDTVYESLNPKNRFKETIYLDGNPNGTQDTFKDDFERDLIDLWNKHRKSLISMATLTVIIAAFGLQSAMRKYLAWLERGKLRSPSSCADKIIASKIRMESDEEIIDRSDLNAILERAISTSGPGYHVVLGPRGSGKTTAVRKACEGKDGVISLSLNTVDVNVYELIAKAFGVFSEHSHFSGESDLVELFEQASKKKGNGWMPTIVCELDRNTAILAKALKRIACDAEAARVILVLDEASDAFVLPPDPKTFVWVDYFTQNEANEYLDKRNFLAGKTLVRNQIFEKIGTRPSRLSRMIEEGEANVEKHLEEVISRAKLTLQRLLALPMNKKDPNYVDYQAIHLALLKEPNGVPKSVFEDNALHDRVCLPLVDYPAFMYHWPSRQYRYTDQAYKVAAKQLSQESIQ